MKIEILLPSGKKILCGKCRTAEHAHHPYLVKIKVTSLQNTPYYYYNYYKMKKIRI